ncbi:MAG: hypothetical protein Q9222_003616 [Ikaeria aurantiellina]
MALGGVVLERSVTEVWLPEKLQLRKSKGSGTNCGRLTNQRAADNFSTNDVTPDAEGPPRNILLLDKSAAPLAEQVKEACDILEITPRSSKNDVQESQQQARLQGPREEWTLRWLLKKLENIPQSQSELLEPNVWMLLRELILRLPVSNLARLLRSHGFLSTLLKLLNLLDAHLQHDEKRNGNGLPSTLPSTTSSDSRGADSSSATIEANPKTSAKSKKRKRDGTSTVSNHIEERVGINPPQIFHIVCDVVSELQALAQDESHGYAVEHLKIALQATPEQAAEILGKALVLLDNLLRNPARSPATKHLGRYATNISPWVALWRCFVPLLGLSTILDDVIETDAHSIHAVTMLEQLLLENVVFPARESFESSKRARASQEDESRKIAFDTVLAPLQNATFRSHIPKDREINYLHPVARFYRICLQHTPLSTPKQRVFGQAWLQFLFDHLRNNLSASMTSSKGPLPINDAIAALKPMLESLLEYGVKLKVPSLEKILVQFSHVLGDVTDDVNWDLVGLCLKMDPDVFIISSSDNSEGPKNQTPNMFLIALFSKVAAVPNEFHDAVLDNVITPLVDGFGHARDLRGFTDHWRSNLIQYGMQSAQIKVPTRNNKRDTDPDTNAEHHQSIWEHEKLLQVVASQIERRLTAGQIEAILLEWKNAYAPAGEMIKPHKQLLCAANLVIIDAILNGCAAEDTISKLSETIGNIYSIMLALPTDKNPHLGYSWRLWRCMTTIRTRWGFTISQNLDVLTAETRASEQAMQIQLGSVDSCAGDEVVYSLAFIVSVMENSEPKLQHEASQSVVRCVASRMETYAEKNQSEPLPGLETQRQLPRILDLERVERHDICLCIFQLVNKPRVLILSDFREYDAINGKNIPQKRMTFFILWQKLLSSRMLEESTAIAKTFRIFQVDTLFQGNNIGTTSAAIEDKTDYALAFQSVHQTPMNTFDRRQRSQICNQVLDILVHDRSLEPQLVTDHLKLLINIIAYPAKGMNILQSKGQRAGEPSPSKDEQVEPVLFKIAASLDDRNLISSSETEICALQKLLASIVLEYDYVFLIQPGILTCNNSYYLSKNNEKQSTTFLKSYHKYLYRQVGTMNFTRAPFTASLIAASLSFYHANFSKFPEEMQSDLQQLYHLDQSSIQSLSEFIQDVGLPVLTNTESSMESPAANRLHPYRLHVLSSLFLRYVEATLQQFVDSRLPLEKRVQPGDHSLTEQAKRALEQTKLLLNADDDVDIIKSHQKGSQSENDLRFDMTSKLKSVLDPIRDQRRSILSKVQHFKTLNTEEMAQHMRRLADQAPDDQLQRENLLMLQAILASEVLSNLLSSEDVSRALSHVVNQLCDSLLQPQPFQTSVLTLHILGYVLHHQLMAAIATSASRPSSITTNTSKQTGLQYLALCRVFSTIIAFHRKRLGGRFHLILAVLKSLLHPLFAPYNTTRLDGPNLRNVTEQTFNTTHATHFARILLQLADPPLSSLAKKTRLKDERHHLNDETKIAKSIAGQHLHYFIMTYCDCHLKGSLAPEIRKKLKPGIWAVLDVIPQEVMRVMNAGMDKAGRAIWKGLYEEWRRDGRGGGRQR